MQRGLSIAHVSSAAFNSLKINVYAWYSKKCQDESLDNRNWQQSRYQLVLQHFENDSCCIWRQIYTKGDDRYTIASHVTLETIA